MKDTFFVLTFLVLVFGTVSFLKDRANTKLAGDILYQGEKTKKTINIIKWSLNIVAILYILKGLYQSMIARDLMAGLDIGVFLASYYLFFINYYIKPVVLAEEGIIKYNNFIRWKHIQGYEIDESNNGKYKLRIKYKRPSEMKVKRMIIDIKEKEQIKNILRDKVIRTELPVV